MDKIKTNKRLNWLDYMKGIGIILVIIGHGFTREYSILTLVFSFHLALFFIVSGMTIKSTTFNLPVHKILVKYIKSIIVPYYILGFFVLLVEIFKNILQKDITVDNLISMTEKYVFLYGLKAEWFLPALFFAVVFVVLLLKLFKGNKILTLLVTAAVAVVCTLISNDNVFLIRILTIGVSTFFVSFGYLVSDLFMNKSHKATAKDNLIYAGLCLLFTAVNIPIAFYNGQVNLVDKVLGNNPILFYVTGILGTLSILFFCKLIDNLKLRILLYTGKNSLVIMAVHMEIMALFGVVISRFVNDGSIEFIILNIFVSYILSLCSVEFANLVLPNKKSKINLKMLKSKR